MGRKPKDRRNRYGAWLHHLRNQKGLSQDALSKMTGVPQSTLAYWEKTGKLTVVYRSKFRLSSLSATAKIRPRGFKSQLD
jgi:transcriptional regulator with XRE-family HTH domain